MFATSPRASMGWRDGLLRLKATGTAPPFIHYNGGISCCTATHFPISLLLAMVDLTGSDKVLVLVQLGTHSASALAGHALG